MENAREREEQRAIIGRQMDRKNNRVHRSLPIIRATRDKLTKQEKVLLQSLRGVVIAALANWLDQRTWSIAISASTLQMKHGTTKGRVNGATLEGIGGRKQKKYE